jgi:hypothetical protein
MAHYCLVNEDRRFIACVNPKCGCTTVKDWFNHTLAVPQADIYRSLAEFMVPAETVEHHDGYFKILILRNPLHRLVSFYYQWVVRNDEDWCFADQGRAFALRGLTFREFLQSLDLLAGWGAEFQHHLVPQTRAVRAVRFDEVVKLDELDQRIRAINRRIGVDYLPKHLNRREYAAARRPGATDLPPSVLADEPTHPVESFYDDELERLARSLYDDDVQLYESL